MGEHKAKKRKKEKKHKRDRDRDEDHAGIFKKALITPNSGITSTTTVLDELTMPSSGDDASSSEDEAPKHKQPSNRGSLSASEILASISTSTSTSTSGTLKTPSMADVADIVAKASRKQSSTQGRVKNNNSDVAGSSQHLSQPSSSSNSGATLSNNELLQSIGVYPTVEMLIRSTLGDTGSHQTPLPQQQQGLGLPTQNAANILANLDNDPSVLATVNNTSMNSNLSHQDMDSTKKKEKKKKSKTKETKEPKEPKEKSSKKSGVSSSKAPSKKIRDLSAQLDKDLSYLSDNPLHTKWMMATELKEKGIKYKTGTFTAKEDNDIKETVREYLAQNNLEENALIQWFQGGDGKSLAEKNELKSLWVQIAVKLEHRPLLNIYLHVRRLYHPQNNVGQWTKQDDAKLVELYAKYKGQWTTIGQELGRMADSCRDRYRNHLKDQSTMISGSWAAHEDERLLEIMHELALLQGKTNILDSTYLWTTVSEKMGGSRSRHQCRHRFAQSLQGRLERGDFKGTIAGDAVIAAQASSSSSSSSSSSQQQRQVLQHGNRAQSKSSSITVISEEERLKNLTDVLQGIIPASEGHLWTQAMTTSANNGDFIDGGYQDLVGSSTNESQSLGVPKSNGTLAWPRASQQLLLEILRKVQKHKCEDHLEVRWNDIMKEIKADLQEEHNAQLDKLSQIQQQLQRQAKKYLQDGDASSLSATAAAAAMTVAIAAAQNESMKVMHNMPTGNRALRSFIAGRAKIEGYRELGFDTIVEVMLKNLEERIDHRDRKVHATAITNAQKSGGLIDPESIVQRTSPKALGPVHQRYLAEFAQSAVLDALLTQFPLLNQLRQRQQQREQAGGDAEDEEEDLDWASITSAVGGSSEQVLKQQRDRDLSEKMIQEAMIEQGLPAFSHKHHRRPNKPSEGFKTKEFVSDSDISDDNSDDDDEL